MLIFICLVCIGWHERHQISGCWICEQKINHVLTWHLCHTQMKYKTVNSNFYRKENQNIDLKDKKKQECGSDKSNCRTKM